MEVRSGRQRLLRAMRQALLGVALAVPLGAGPAVGADDELVEPTTGVAFPTSPTVEGVEYACLGTGIRRLFLFKVYAVAFCLDAERSRSVIARAKRAGRADAYLEGLADADTDKLVVLRMVRDVSASTMARAFRTSMAGVLPPGKIDVLAATIPGDAQAGQTVLISSREGTLRIDIDGLRDAVDDAEIARELWRVWLDPGGIAPTLRKDLVARAGL